ncbi:MAG: cupin domain-containing protein [Planctomycetota bacterium]
MEPQVRSLEEMETEQFPWGSITWLVSGEIGNSESMTFGRVVIRRGERNGEHSHRNCDEILHLLQGELEHTAGPDASFHLGPGDTITLPAGTRHYARSVGDRDAIMLVTYNTARREVDFE